jgi:glycosyltransferase involved in cell wall biosynthesis
MQVWGTSVLRDEEDIIPFTLRHLIAEGVDGFVLLDHGSTDSTASSVEKVAKRGGAVCHLFSSNDRGFRQGTMMTELAGIAQSKGADWIIPFDADELWYSSGPRNLVETIRNFSGGAVIRVPLWDHLPTTRDPSDPNPFRRMPYRRKEKFSATKIAYKAASNHRIVDGSHAIVDTHTTLSPRSSEGDISIRHFPVRGFDHFLKKARKMSEGLKESGLPTGAGIQWRSFGMLSDEELRVIYFSRYYIPDPEDNGMIYDPASYKELL